MIRKIAIAAAACLWASLAFGQANNSNTWQTPGNQTVGGQVQMCLNASNIAVPCSAPTAGSGNSGYPPGSTPANGVFTGADTTSASASIAGSAGQFAYLCSFEINGLGATAATTVTPTLSGIGGGSPPFQGQYTFPLGAAVVATPLIRSYSPCLRTLNPGGGFSVVVPGAAGNTTTNITVYGYTQ